MKGRARDVALRFSWPGGSASVPPQPGERALSQPQPAPGRQQAAGARAGPRERGTRCAQEWTASGHRGPPQSGPGGSLSVRGRPCRCHKRFGRLSHGGAAALSKRLWVHVGGQNAAVMAPGGASHAPPRPIHEKLPAVGHGLQRRGGAIADDGGSHSRGVIMMSERMFVGGVGRGRLKHGSVGSNVASECRGSRTAAEERSRPRRQEGGPRRRSRAGPAVESSSRATRRALLARGRSGATSARAAAGAGVRGRLRRMACVGRLGGAKE